MLSQLKDNVERFSMDLSDRSRKHRISMNDDNVADTVITITGDHVPQTLNKDGMLILFFGESN